ncbi:MAG: hypothetical protein RQ723_06765 [Desulfuromonadales bacterium]|nr:hypothetical protein [Desulfuromonadales bacterium]
MGLRIFIFEEDPSLLRLLTLFLEKHGHQVQGMLDPFTCPIYQQERCSCPATSPCAEAVIVNTRTPLHGPLDLLLDQDRKGCKLPRGNKAIMCASFLSGQEEQIRQFGFATIRKPFRLAKIEEWLSSCASALAVSSPAQS